MEVGGWSGWGGVGCGGLCMAVNGGANGVCMGVGGGGCEWGCVWLASGGGTVKDIRCGLALSLCEANAGGAPFPAGGSVLRRVIPAEV